MNCPHCTREIDLHRHDAEVRNPLVEALEKILGNGMTVEAIGLAYDALAKVKEGRDL